MGLHKIIAIYLAAGASRRMGENKLALPFAGTTVGSKGIITALSTSIDHLLIVKKPDDPLDWVDPLLFTGEYFNKWSIVISKEAHNGQACSIRSGVQRAQKMNASAVLIMLADQPFVSGKVINELLKDYKKSLFHHQALSFAAPRLNNTVHPPVLFSKQTFPDLMNLRGDEGARSLFKGDRFPNGRFINQSHSVSFLDIDTPEDYEKLLKVDSSQKA